MELDAQTFADWGIDSLKLDGCYSGIEDMKEGRYQLRELHFDFQGVRARINFQNNAGQEIC